MTMVIMLMTLLATLGSGELTQAAAKIEVHGHRGARARLPENTLPAFEYALEAGADVLEMDLAVTSDKVLVISHDPHVSKVICVDAQGRPLATEPLIHSLTLAEVKKFDCGTLKNPRFEMQKPVPGTRIPTLEEVFELVKKSRNPNAHKIRFNIETKIFADHPEYTVGPEEFSSLLMNVLKKHKMLSRSIIQSFDFRTLVLMRKLNPKTVISALVEKRSIDMVEAATRLKADIVSPDWELVTPELVDKLHAIKVQVAPWTADTVESWKKLVDLKVDAIITDDPAGLIEFLSKRR